VGPPDVDGLYAWLSRNTEGREGIVTVWVPDGPVPAMPAVFASERLARKLTPYMQARGHPAVLVKFTRQETVATVQPPAQN
jgi:hypothetical protein